MAETRAVWRKSHVMRIEFALEDRKQARDSVVKANIQDELKFRTKPSWNYHIDVRHKHIGPTYSGIKEHAFTLNELYTKIRNWNGHYFQKVRKCTLYNRVRLV